MENISNFLEACKTYGVAEISCFQTVDLYENKQCYKVIECLRSLAAVVSTFYFPPCACVVHDNSCNALYVFQSYVIRLLFHYIPPRQQALICGYFPFPTTAFPGPGPQRPSGFPRMGRPPGSEQAAPVPGVRDASWGDGHPSSGILPL